MSTIEDLRPEPRPLDPAWSTATLQAILASPVPGRPRHPGGRLVAAAAATAAVGAVVTAMVGLRPDPAFAVDREADGDIVVTVRELADADGLERALAERGIRAEVTYHPGAASPSDLDDGSSTQGCPPVGLTIDPNDDGGFAFTLEADYLAAHDSALRLDVAGGATSDDWMAVSVTWVATSTC